MDLDKSTEQLGKLDKLLTEAKLLLKRHWGFLILICVGLIIWWFVSLVKDEVENPTEEPYVIETYEEDGKVIEVWSDGLETVIKE